MLDHVQLHITFLELLVATQKSLVCARYLSDIRGRADDTLSSSCPTQKPKQIDLLPPTILNPAIHPLPPYNEYLVMLILGTHAEVEAFCHGALCVSYSGQCFSSEAWGGRSANRGQCAQACRMPYGLLVNGQIKVGVVGGGVKVGYHV